MRYCILGLLIATGALAQQDSLTIGKAVEIVLKRHPSINQAQEALEAARAHTQSLTSANYPSVSADVSDFYLGPEYPFNLGMAKFAMFPDNNFDAHIGAMYTLYDFGKRSMTIEVSKTGEQSAADLLTGVKTDLYFQVLQLFTAIVLQEKSIVVADEGIAEYDRHLLDVQKKIEAGSATEYDVLKTQVPSGRLLKVNALTSPPTLQRSERRSASFSGLRRERPLSSKAASIHFPSEPIRILFLRQH